MLNAGDMEIMGQLGNGDTIDRTTPVDVHTSASDNSPLSDIAAISSGNTHTCAITINDKVKCWGQGSYGRLGNRFFSNKPTPVDVHTSPSDSSPLSEVAAISAGDYHTCALMINNTVKCWGSGSNGQLGIGDGDSDERTTPVDVHTSFTNSDPLSDIAAISAGGYHTCAITINNKVKCWGYGKHGQLGNGDSDERTTPVDIVDIFLP